MGRMQRDSGEPAEAGKVEGRGRGAGWRARLSSTPGILVLVPAIAGVGFLGGYLVTVFALFPVQGPRTSLVSVPELVGRTADEARRLLDSRGLGYVEAASLHHPEAPAGRVVAQSPLPRQMARPAAPVRVTLSLGPREQVVPDVSGLSWRQAQIVLARDGFRTDVGWVDAERDVGDVVSTDPEAGSRVQLPGDVRVLVSSGPPRVEVPDLVTHSLSESQGVLERLGLKLGKVGRDWASQEAPGTVISQSPASGTVVDRGTQIRVTVAVVPPRESRDSISPAADSTNAGNGR